MERLVFPPPIDLAPVDLRDLDQGHRLSCCSVKNMLPSERASLISDEIVNEFIRLGVSPEDCPFSGLFAEPANVVAKGTVVRIFDDYASGHYNGNQVLAALKHLDDTTLDSIWDTLKPYEI